MLVQLASTSLIQVGTSTDTVALAHSPEQVLANLVVEQKRHYYLVYDAAIAWERHREAQAAVDKLLQTTSPASTTDAAITKADKAWRALCDADLSVQQSKAHLIPIEEHADLVATAYPNSTVQAVAAASDEHFATEASVKKPRHTNGKL
jgi:hypothetical protein